MMIKPYFALVNATLRRRGSFRNPIPEWSLERTHVTIIKSFSRPLNSGLNGSPTMLQSEDLQIMNRLQNQIFRDFK